ncbi:MAG TPA: putative baseplate assembly protein, partial [Enhygromyxa sp.]|nr:putative baseplate assembly protein [Enhygromyxa sp.]
MTLPSPILDDRSYAQLRDDLLRRIPVYNPQWTDHNASDPGITLIELFAYLGETLLFRFNQIPEATKLEFLRLLQIARRPPSPARGLLRMRPKTEVAAGTLVDPGAVAQAGAVAFETQLEVAVLPVEAIATCKSRVDPPDADAEPERFGELQRVIDALDGLASDEQAAPYEVVTVDLDGQAAPVDFDRAVDSMIWIALLADAKMDPAAVREQLATPVDGGPALLNLGFVPDLAAGPADEIDPCPGQGVGRPDPSLAWQISTGRIHQGKPIYASLRTAVDTTGGLEREGVLALELPGSLGDIGVFELDDDALAGAGEFPPVLDDEQEPRLVCWLRVFRTDGVAFGKVQWIGANATEVIAQRRANTVLLGVGDGQPGQELSLMHAPVIPGSLVLEVEEPEGWTAWTEVDGFHASGEDDRHFVVDPIGGKLRFGNGVQGRAPQQAERIRARSWLYGGGAEGNVAAGTIKKLGGFASILVDNPLPAWGGAPAETVAEALDRIPGELRRRDRCVARDDFRELAMQTPGADLGRAEVLARFHPPTRVEQAAGVVSVVVWPRVDAAHPSAPLPDRRTLRRVCEWLDARRLVTTELYVIPPRYVKIAVAVAIAIKPGYPIQGVRRWVELILRQYLAPLPPYGPEGRGWPLGDRVVAGKLEAAALQVEGVEYVRDLRIAIREGDEETGSWVEIVADPTASPPVEAVVGLRIDEVPELAEITVIEG